MQIGFSLLFRIMQETSVISDGRTEQGEYDREALTAQVISDASTEQGL